MKVLIGLFLFINCISTYSFANGSILSMRQILLNKNKPLPSLLLKQMDQAPYFGSHHSSAHLTMLEDNLNNQKNGFDQHPAMMNLVKSGLQPQLSQNSIVLGTKEDIGITYFIELYQSNPPDNTLPYRPLGYMYPDQITTNGSTNTSTQTPMQSNPQNNLSSLSLRIGAATPPTLNEEELEAVAASLKILTDEILQLSVQRLAHRRNLEIEPSYVGINRNTNYISRGFYSTDPKSNLNPFYEFNLAQFLHYDLDVDLYAYFHFIINRSRLSLL